jgi:hypothetical protein
MLASKKAKMQVDEKPVVLKGPGFRQAERRFKN